jgi:hypothetical protein
MSLGLIVGLLLIVVVVYFTWKNRQDSFSKTHLGKKTEYAAQQKETEDREGTEDKPEEDS